MGRFYLILRMDHVLKSTPLQLDLGAGTCPAGTLLTMMEKDEFIETYLEGYKRKPVFVHRTKEQDRQNVLEAGKRLK